MSRGTPDPAAPARLSRTWLSHSLAGFPKAVPLDPPDRFRGPKPRTARRPPGLACSPFARRYSGNRFFFLLLALLRCFSSGAYPPRVMCWRAGGRGSHGRVSPFGNPRIKGYVRLPVAYRSLSRPSSAPSAKASTLRSSSLDRAPPRRGRIAAPGAAAHSVARTATGRFFKRCRSSAVSSLMVFPSSG